MNAQKFANSGLGVSLALFLAQVLPPELGYVLGRTIVGQVTKRKFLPIVQAVRLNQLVARGQNLSPQELDKAVNAVFHHAGRCLVDHYHNISRPDVIRSFFPETAEVRKFIERSQKNEKGAFIATLHLSNFDLAFLSLTYRGFKAQVLTFGRPTAGYQIQNSLRSKTGLDITPINRKTLYQAVHRMKSGGMVITAIDRPVQEIHQKVMFFGQPAPMPTGHIRMALTADVPIILAVPAMQPDGTYRIFVSDPIPMQRFSDPLDEIRINAEAVLKIVEDQIRQYPDQWLMYYPVWPELMNSIL